MCGIAGVATIDHEQPGMLDRVRKMTATAAHRGPDDVGTFVDTGIALGHRRLAIIDPTSAGHQPLISPDQRLALTYNGEIYNYRDLRRALASSWDFRSDCDTEVLLAAWAHWGIRCLDRLRGMFAFAVWDDVERALYLARDRFAIKPLFYAETAYALYFASEVRQLQAASVDLIANNRMVYDFLEHGLVEGSGPETFFRNVSQVPAGSCLRWKPGQSHMVTYYDVRQRPRDEGPLEAALNEAVGLHLRSDVPVGSCLSGGLDSSVLVSLVHAMRTTETDNQYVVTAGVDDPAIDERAPARRVARHLGVPAIEVVPQLSELLVDLPQLVRCQEQPFTNLGVYLQWRVMKAAAQHGLKVMLDGQGADEIFGGYLRHRMAFGRELLRHGRARQLRRLLAPDAPGNRARLHNLLALLVPSSLQRMGLAVYRGESVRKIAGPRLDGMSPNGRSASFPRASLLDRTRLDDILWRSLPALLRYEDRNSMAFGVEARVPYLDHVVVERALAVSGEALFRDAASKAPLRALAAKLLPDDVAYRRDKLGFDSAQPQWFRSALGSHAEEVLSDPSVRDRGLVDADSALHQLGRARQGGATTKVWRALSVVLWDDLVLRDPTRAHA